VGAVLAVDGHGVGVVVFAAAEVGAVGGGGTAGGELGEEGLAARLAGGWAAGLTAHGVLEGADLGEVGGLGAAGDVGVVVVVDVDAAGEVTAVAAEVGGVDDPVPGGGELGDERVVGARQVAGAGRGLEPGLEGVADRQVGGVGEAGHVDVGVVVDRDGDGLLVEGSAEQGGPHDAAGGGELHDEGVVAGFTGAGAAVEPVLQAVAGGEVG
jgi:hypothetical protein